MQTVERDKTRLKPETRRELILAAAMAEAEKVGYQQVTRDAIAKRAGVAPGLVSHYFATMPQLKRDIMRAAVRLENAAIVAQGLACADPHAKKASPELKRAALASF